MPGPEITVITRPEMGFTQQSYASGLLRPSLDPGSRPPPRLALGFIEFYRADEGVWFSPGFYGIGARPHDQEKGDRPAGSRSDRNAPPIRELFSRRPRWEPCRRRCGDRIRGWGGLSCVYVQDYDSASGGKGSLLCGLPDWSRAGKHHGPGHA